MAAWPAKTGSAPAASAARTASTAPSTSPGPAPALLVARRAGDGRRTARREVVRRAGTDERPILRLDGAATARRSRRCAARSCSSRAPRRPRSARTSGGPRTSRAARSPTATRHARPRAAAASALPSCEVLEVERAGRRRAARPAGPRRGPRASTSQARRIDVDAGVPRRRRRRPADADRRRHALPGVVRLVPRPAPRANAIAGGHELRCLNPRDHTPLSGGQVDDTPFGGGAGMVLRVDVMDARAARPSTTSIRSSCATSAA